MDGCAFARGYGVQPGGPLLTKPPQSFGLHPLSKGGKKE